MNQDIVLLRDYAQNHSQAAFAQLVQRHIGLVYAVALRQVGGDAHLAEDAAQKVFVALARQAKSLLDRASLSGWLHRTSHHIAVDLVRAEHRRRVREQRGDFMADAVAEGTGGIASERLRSLLDESMRALNERDRDAVALRFFEGCAFTDVGRLLGVTEEAARKRVERALERMAAALARRGISSSSAAVALVLTETAAVAAPPGLAASVSGTAIAAAAASSPWLGFFGATKLAAGFGAAAVAASFWGWQQFQRAEHGRAEVAVLARDHDRLIAQTADAQRGLTHVEQRARAAESDNAELLAAIGRLKDSRAAEASLASAARAARSSTAEVPAPPDESPAAEPRLHLRLIQLSRGAGETDQVLLNRASVVLARLRAGETFEALAKEYSNDLRRLRGGDWGWLKPGDLKSDFRDRVFALQKGETSAPMLKAEGCFIAYAEDRK